MRDPVSQVGAGAGPGAGWESGDLRTGLDGLRTDRWFITGPRSGTVLAVIGFIVFGLVVGVLARLLVPGKQQLTLVATVVLGLVGSVVGGLIANALGTGDILELNFLGSVVAILASVVLIVIGERVGAVRRRFSRD
jgi:uncharacterized membrane protein YeaQ/YmgE (transglycosylase-associated protein family)